MAKRHIPPSKWEEKGVIDNAILLLKDGHSLRYSFGKSGACEPTAVKLRQKARLGEENVLLPRLEEIEKATQEGLDNAINRVMKDDLTLLDEMGEGQSLELVEEKEVFVPDGSGDTRFLQKRVSAGKIKERILRAVTIRDGLTKQVVAEQPYEKLQADRRVLRDPAEFIYAIGERDTVEDVLADRAEYANAPTEQQAAILRDIATHDRVVVASANSQGKSHLMIRLAVWNLLKPGSTTIITASEARVLRLSIMPKINAMAARLGVPGRLKQSIRPEEDNDEWQLVSYSADTAEGASGIHPSGSFLILVDEAQGMTQTFYEAMEGQASGRGNKLVLFGNPLYLEGPFFDAASDTSGTWQQHHLSALDHPNVVHDRMIYKDAIDRAWVMKRKEEWGTDSDAWRTRVLGLFPKVDPEGLHFLSRDQIAKLSTPAGEPSWFKAMGL